MDWSEGLHDQLERQKQPHTQRKTAAVILMGKRMCAYVSCVYVDV